MDSGWWCGTFHFFATITTKKAGRNFISSCFFHLPKPRYAPKKISSPIPIKITPPKRVA